MATELNDKQKEAVETTEGPVLVIAGAGSGKTRVLTERIAHLIRDKGVPPQSILAFTFTNRAAREMKERLESSLKGMADRLWVGTFHATGVRILRAHGDRIGLPRSFSIYDADDSLALVKDVITRQAAQGRLLRSPRSIRDQISRWKNDLITPELAFEQVSHNIDKRIAEVYRAYEKSIRRAKALDFDDLIAKVVELFSVQTEVRDYYAKHFQYILVDEFQDTNPIQMAMIDGLTSHYRNLFVVGDDDQSIYSWRGAKVEHILNFDNLYAGTKVIRLEQNYRSTQTILDAANQMISHNIGRKGKTLWTAGDTGEKVTLLVSMDEESEAMNVLHTVRELESAGTDLRDIAVLYRTNAQSRALEDVLKLGSTPYQIIGSVRFYERMEVRDILAYCKLIANPADDVSLKRILNVPKRGLGKTTFERLASVAAFRDVSMMDLLRAGGYDVPSAQAKRLAGFLALFETLSRVAAEAEAPKVIESILDETDYRSHLHENYPDGDSRVENVEELVAAAEVYTSTREDRTLAAFLEEIALVADIDTLSQDRGQLTLMTIHNAKGLEFGHVIITGLEDGLFPHFNSMDSPSQLEEERRLFYVGMTRARKRLYCSYANMRRRMGVIEGGAPSRFLFEVPEQCIDASPEARALHLNLSTEAGMDLELDPSFSVAARRAGIKRREFEDYSQEEVIYAVGMKIRHDDFGPGIIRKVEGSGEDLRVTVLFNRGDERKFLAHYAPMQPL